MPVIPAADGTSLFATDWGAGDPVVLVHGLGLGSDMWEYLTHDLTDRGLRCAAYDQRGAGRSDHPPSGYDFDTFADDLAAVLGGLDLRAVTLVGFSLGCGVIARYLSRHGSDRVARAALVSTGTPWLLKAPGNPGGMDRAGVFDTFVGGLRRDRPATLAAMVPGFFGAAGVSPDLARWAVGLFDRAAPRAVLELYRLHCETDFAADLAAVAVPTLVVHGADDPFSPPDLTARRTAEAVPGSRLEVYDGASHGLPFTHRERFAADVAAFARA